MATSIQALVSNVKAWISAIAVSAGVADASKVPLTNSSGILDNSFINWGSPGSIGATTPNNGIFNYLQAYSATRAWVDVLGGSGSSKDVVFLTGTNRRWIVQSSSAIEAGSNAGSDFQIVAYTDAGASIDVPFKITRASGGAAAFVRPVTMSQTLDVTGNLTGTAVTASSTLKTTATTASSSSATGALQSAGGLGVAGNINAGGTSHSLGSNSGASSLLTLNALSSGNKLLLFQSAGLSRWAFYSAGGGSESFTLSYYDDTGTYVGDLFSCTRAGVWTIGSGVVTTFGNTTDSSSTTTGAIKTSGGIGIAKNLNVGGNFAVTGTLKVGSGGSTITRVLLASSSALDTVSVGAQTSTTITVTVTGATIGDQVNANPSSATPNTNFSLHGYVSAANAVTVVAYNRAATSQSFSGNVKVSVIG